MPNFESCINCIDRHTFVDSQGKTKTCHCICEKYKKSKVISDEELAQMHKENYYKFCNPWDDRRMKR